MRERNANVSVFVPHAGCPHRCSFCDQRSVSGTQAPPTPEEAARTARQGLEQLGERAASSQLAFFGGSFTAIEPEYRRALLEAVRPYVGGTGYHGIRVSTRPDAVDSAVLRELKLYGVEAVELGIQSMDDRVLARNRRGHSAAQAVEAAALIRSLGLSLGCQMMTGLPGDDAEGAWATARAIAEMGPDTVRIYPALTLRNTQMARWYGEGSYHPQALEEAVELCAGLLEFFLAQEIRVIRLGLHGGGELEGDIVAGPWHPAFRELCEGRILLEKAKGEIRKLDPKGGGCPVELRVHPRSLSKMAGQGRRNRRALEEMGYPARIVADPSLGPLEVSAARV